jgi:EAL domain-containing protein (putative c-di-GMP-specific phosphodiesterase class I)
LFSIRRIINNRSIKTHFQPIVSLKQKRIIGIEALSRGFENTSSPLIPPLELISQAHKEGVGLELDRVFRSNTFEKYKNAIELHNMLLFVNVDTKILDHKNLEFGWTYEKAKSLNLNISNIIIEICESKIADTGKLIQFVENYRKYGFLIAVDDFGNSHSNLERIIQVKPDIIKVSKNLVDGIFENFYKESIIKSILQLSKSIGAAVIAEGVENKYDVMKCFELGIDLFQGFYFAEPSDCCEKDSESCMNKISQTLFKMNDYLRNHINKKAEKINNFILENDEIKTELALQPYEKIFFKAKEIILTNEHIECIRIFDSFKNTSVEFCAYKCLDLKTKHEIFQNGCNASSNLLKNNLEIITYDDNTLYITDEFMSVFTKNFCKTFSSKFKNSENYEFILCIDFIINESKKFKEMSIIAN